MNEGHNETSPPKTIFASGSGCGRSARRFARRRAQRYPVRSITLVVPIASGGAVDTAARITAEKLHERLRQPIVVENRPGAGSIIGTAFVAKAPRDGYALLLMEPGAVLAK
jgi:tripartite-type tricarboxylate transporter receptor subunit TctC